MVEHIKVWEASEGKIQEILVTTEGEEYIITLSEVDATLENITLLLEQSPKLFEMLSLERSSIQTRDSPTDRESSSEPTIGSEHPIEETDDFEAWIQGEKRWEPGETGESEAASSVPEALNFKKGGSKYPIDIKNWGEMETIENNACPACGKQLKNNHGVISHLSSGTCTADKVTTKQHQFLNIREKKLLIFIATLTYDEGATPSVSLREVIQTTGQNNVKGPLDSLANEGKVNKDLPDENNPKYSITETGLNQIKSVFEPNPGRLETVAPSFADWLFDEFDANQTDHFFQPD